MNLPYNRRRSNGFEDARFWFMPKPNQILPNLPKFYINFTQFIQIYSNFTQICSNFAQIYLKKFARECGSIPKFYATDFHTKVTKTRTT